MVKGGVAANALGGIHDLFTVGLGTVSTTIPLSVARRFAFPDGAFNADLLSTLSAKVGLPEGYQVVYIATGNGISADISDTGELRVCGSFRANESTLGFATDMHAQFRGSARSSERKHRPSRNRQHSPDAGERCQLGRRVVERCKINDTNSERVILGSRGCCAVCIGAVNMRSFAEYEAGYVWGWNDGRVYACGRADAAALGLPKDHQAPADGAGSVNEPVRVPFPNEEDDDPVVHINASTTYSAAVTKDGVLYTLGELGQGGMDMSVTPGVVVRREGGKWGVTTVSWGGQHAMALLPHKEA
ncbi:RCC1/BLIP-II protein [Peniophora sp. CONT]|nr:RCC1/BLIP-II protein [Peniophora sp. CONT]